MVEVHILENDRLGSPTGTMAGLEIEDYLCLQSKDCFEEKWGAKLRYESTYGGGRIVLFEQLYFKVYSQTEWAGSICWNNYVMPYGYALSLINCLLRSGRFNWEYAEVGICQKIKNGEELTGADFDWQGVEPIEPLIYNENQLQLPL